MGPIDLSTLGGDSLTLPIAALLVAARVVSPRWPYAIRHGLGLLDIKENKKTSFVKCCVCFNFWHVFCLNDENVSADFRLKYESWLARI